MSTIAFVQARTSSVRIPKKTLLQINGRSSIEILLRRLSKAKKIDKIVVVVPKKEKNLLLIKIIKKLKFNIFFGSEKDLLDRFYQAAKKHKAKTIVRITGDCPLIDPNLVDETINLFKKTKSDYTSNNEEQPYPDGMDVEVTSFSLLRKAWKESCKSSDREHVTPFISRLKNIKKTNLKSKKNYDHLRLTLDEKEDLEVISSIFKNFAPSIFFSLKKISELYEKKPYLFKPNSHLKRDEGYHIGEGQKLWKRAKKLIPGGNMLLSKRSEIFLPDVWPSYFSKSKGCSVWSLEGKKFIDMSIMSVGTNILGYGHPEIDNAVRETINRGNMSSLNCPEEVELAERLIDLHPWSDMAKFARTGGEANAVAIRIARATTGKDKVAICGYHGWHDWYLAANLKSSKNLNEHLISGLNTFGVPKSLEGTIFPFSYNNFSQLEKIIEENPEIGTIKLEVSRNLKPKNNFLKRIRDLSTKKNIVLIFDECTSGFRETFGGLHKKYNVNPDMAIFGKALGNGYAITSIIGRKEIMEIAKNTFISSTFWTERVGPTAAIATLNVMEKLKSWEIISKIGIKIKKRWQDLAKKHKIEINTFGLDPIPSFSFKSSNDFYYQTYMTQEMLKKGYLSISSIFVCINHKEKIISKYFKALDPIFKTIAECEKGKDIKNLISKKLPHTGFERLN